MPSGGTKISIVGGNRRAASSEGGRAMPSNKQQGIRPTWRQAKDGTKRAKQREQRKMVRGWQMLSCGAWRDEEQREEERCRCDARRDQRACSMPRWTMIQCKNAGGDSKKCVDQDQGQNQEGMCGGGEGACPKNKGGEEGTLCKAIMGQTSWPRDNNTAQHKHTRRDTHKTAHTHKTTLHKAIPKFLHGQRHVCCYQS